MNWPAALVAYLLNAIAVMIYPAVLFRILTASQVSSLGSVMAYLMIFSIFGMVLMPYFEIASFTSSRHGYWKEVAALVHRHISIPFIGGYSLSFLGLYTMVILFGTFASGGLYRSLLAYFDPILATYVAFVIAGSVITILANRKAPLPAVTQMEPAAVVSQPDA